MSSMAIHCKIQFVHVKVTEVYMYLLHVYNNVTVQFYQNNVVSFQLLVNA